tara:strand:- start:334 stop:585 length:252 start_codon:yes stop_codon:yes gene_type:complete
MEIKVGDMLWVKLKGPANDYGFGEVKEVYQNENNEVCFTFYCLVNGGLRSGLKKEIINKPTGRMVAKLSQSRKEVQEVLKNKR